VSDLVGRKNVVIWDEHRNTSRVFPVPPGALDAAAAALARFRIDSPAHAEWIESGHPTLSDDEHVSRFGEVYDGARSRTTRARGQERL
jgi:hypothetical protein